MKRIDIICIIDDDPIYVFVTKKALESASWSKTVWHFENGKETYEKLKVCILSKENLPDLILLDINMPIWDGWDFLDEFTQIPIDKEIIIYLVSSSNNPVDIKRARNYKKVNNYLIKPITMEKLKKELQSIC